MATPKSKAHINPNGDSVAAGTVVAHNTLNVRQGGTFKNDGNSVFSQNALMSANLLVGGTIFTDNIVEYTFGTGVTIEGVLFHNGMVSATALQGINVNAMSPTSGQVLGFNGANWIPIDAAGIGMLIGDVTGAPNATVVSFVNGQSATAVATATAAVNSATHLDTPSTLVQRDSFGDFRAGTISADLHGNADTVSAVGDQSASTVAAATVLVNAATSSNVNNSLVLRDASGNFQASTVSANLNGTASSAVSFTGSLIGDVTGNQSATVVNALQGTPVSSAAPATHQVLQFNGSNWLPTTLPSPFDPLDPICFGINTSSNNAGVGSITVGVQAVTVGSNAPIAIGSGSNSRSAGIAFGTNATSNGQYGLAFGSNTSCNGIDFSIALGTTTGNVGATVPDSAHALALALNPASISSGPNQLGCCINGTNYQIPLTVSVGGDVTGNMSATTVSAIRGVAVNSSAPSISGQNLCYDGTQWQPGVVFPNGTVALGGSAAPNAALLNQSTGIGYQALLNSTTGANGNTAVGYQAGDTITTGNYNVIIGQGADVMANMNSYGIAIGHNARTNSRGVAIGNTANTNSVLNAVALGENAAPSDASHAIAFAINAASVSDVAPGPGSGTSYLGITINGVNYKIAIVADL